MMALSFSFSIVFCPFLTLFLSLFVSLSSVPAPEPSQTFRALPNLHCETGSTKACEMQDVYIHALRTTFEMQSGYSRRLALAELRFDANLGVMH
mmetsp:Transcript_71588/g.116053  ORF Transcript_71588/g.116053 Transcript_71588/m.116053 type:complete len:94 (+) Transcript_71588:843-1124(+)